MFNNIWGNQLVTSILESYPATLLNTQNMRLRHNLWHGSLLSYCLPNSKLSFPRNSPFLAAIPCDVQWGTCSYSH